MAHSGVSLINPKEIFEKINLSHGMRVADFGCGRTGQFIFPAARVVGDSGIVYAVDILKEVLESIKSRVRSEAYDNIQLIWSDVEMPGKIPIPENSLDVCFMVNILNHLKNRFAGVVEGARCLKRGGLMVVIDWQKKLGALGPSQEDLVDFNQIKSRAGEVNLQEFTSFKAGDYHFCLVLRKI